MIIGIDVRHVARGPHTGVAEATQKLLEHLFLAAPEDSFRIFYNGSAKPPSFVTDWTARFSNVSVKFWRIPNRLFDRALKVFQRPYLDTLLSGADVFLSPHALLTPLASAPRVLVVHDLSFFVHPEFFSPQSRWWHRFMNIHSQALKAASLIVPSEATAFDLVRLWGVPREKITVIPWGASQQVRSDLLHSTFYIPTSRYILFLGTVERRKNVLGLLQAFEQLKEDPAFADVTLVLAGALGWGSEQIIAKIKKQKVNIGNAVEILGYVSEEKKAELFAQATLFVYPSFYEGFGLPVLDALASGVPVIASNYTSMPEVTGNAALLVDPRRPEQIVSAMRAVLSDEAFAKELSRRGIERAKQFTWEKTAQQVLVVLRETALKRTKQ